MKDDYFNSLRRKMRASEMCNVSDSIRREMTDNIDGYLDEKVSPTIYTVDFVDSKNVGISKFDRKINVNVTDVSKNDQKSNDEKYFNFKMSDNVSTGDQIFWSNKWWILYHEEMISTCSHKTFTAKKCNFNYRYEYKGIIYDIPSHLLNLTLYSDGMSNMVYMTNQNGSRKIILPINELTNNLIPGIRIMATKNTVFEVAHIDEFSRENIKECILSQIFKTSKDNSNENTAFNEESKVEIVESIKGSSKILLGGSEVYTTDILDYGRWEIESKENCAIIDTSYNGCRIICSDNHKYIGEKIKLSVTKYGVSLASKEITIRGMF